MPLDVLEVLLLMTNFMSLILNTRLCDGNFGSQEVWSFFDKETKVAVIKVLRQWSSARHSVSAIKKKRLDAIRWSNSRAVMYNGRTESLPMTCGGT